MTIGIDPINQTSVRAMQRAVEIRKSPLTFLTDRLVKERVNSDSKYIEIDKISGNRFVAQYTPRYGGALAIGKGGYGNLIHIAPYVKHEISYGSSDVDVRDAGVDPYSGISNLDLKKARWMLELDQRITTLEELQVAQALQTGKITVLGEGVSYEVDFQQDALHLPVLATTACWDAPTTNDILGNLASWAELLRNDGFAEQELILSKLAAGYLLSDTKVKAVFDMIRFNPGEIKMRALKDQHATYLGHMSWDGFDLDLYSYYGTYDYLNGSAKASAAYMNSYSAIMLGAGIDARMHYGKLENLAAQAQGFKGSRFLSNYMSLDGSQGFLKMESSPMFGLHTPEGVVCATVKS